MMSIAGDKCAFCCRQTAQQRLEEDQQSIEGARSSVRGLQQDIEQELSAMKVGAIPASSFCGGPHVNKCFGWFRRHAETARNFTTLQSRFLAPWAYISSDSTLQPQ